MTFSQADARVVGAALEGFYWRIHLRAPTLAVRLRPGQFVTANLGGELRVPFLPVVMGREDLNWVVRSDHPAADLAPGHTVDLLGPMGKPLSLPQPPARLLLIADDLHLPALLPAANQALAAGCPVALLLAVPSAPALYPLSFLPPALEVHVMTADGSAGHAGSLGDGGDVVGSLLVWADQVLVAADPACFPVLMEAVQTVRIGPGSDFVRVFLLPPIVCGVGACQGCVVSTRKGYRRTCVDGPFFSLLEVEMG